MTLANSCAYKHLYCVKKVIAYGSLVTIEASSEIAVDDQEDKALKRCKSKCMHLVSSTTQGVSEVIAKR